MKRQMIFAAALLGLGSPTVADEWTTGNWVVSEYVKDGGAGITLICKGIGQRVFVLTFPTTMMSPAEKKQSVADLAMDVKGRDDTIYRNNAKAKVELAGDQMRYTLEGHDAWVFMSSVAFSKEVYIGTLREGAAPDSTRLSSLVMNTYSGETENAAHAVLGACKEEEPSPIKPQ